MSIEPDHMATSRAWSWRHAVAKSGLPPITRLVLHTLGLKMDATGGSCYPPVSELVDLTGLDKKTVLKHLDIAEENGWIEVSQHGFRGQKWKRNEYVARWPGRDLVGEPASSADGKGGGNTPPPCDAAKVVESVPEGGGNGSRKVVEQFHQDKILPANIPDNSPAAGAEGRELKRDERKKIERDFIAWFALWDLGDPGYARNAWFALTAEERAECIERTPAYLGWIKKGERHAGAVFLKNREWRDLPEHLLAPPEVTRGIAKPFGKLWMGTRFAALLAGATGPVVLTAFDRQRIESGQVSKETLLADKRRTLGWPLVNEMHDHFRRREPFLCSLSLRPHVESFRSIHRDSAVFAAWRRLHDRRNWPFLDHANEWTYFPAVDETVGDLDAAVEAALTEFATIIKEGKADDAA